MVAARFMAFATLVGLAYAVAPTASGMQDEIDPVNRKPTGYFDVKRYKTEGIPDGKMNEAKARFVMFAKYNAEAMDALETGAKRAGRRIDDIDRPQLVICSVDNDRKHALDMARKMMTQYLGQQPHLMKASGVSQELLDEIHQVLTWPATEEEIEGAMHLVPDDVVQMCTASGSPDEVKAKVREYIASGATCPILYPLGDPRLMIEIFEDGYQG